MQIASKPICDVEIDNMITDAERFNQQITPSAKDKSSTEHDPTVKKKTTGLLKNYVKGNKFCPSRANESGKLKSKSKDKKKR